jgi:hypothetical protein
MDTLGQGPMVLIDEAHSDFHTATGRYLPFAGLLRRGGYVVKASAAQFTPKAPEAGRVLVIANAVAALTAEKVAAVRDRVAGGGSLPLIAGHPPFRQLLLHRDLEITLAVVVTPTSGHRVLVDLAVDDVVDRVAPAVLCIGFEVHCPRLGIEGRFLQFNCVRTGIHSASEFLAVPLQFDSYLIPVIGARPPIADPTPAQWVTASLLRKNRSRNDKTRKQAKPGNGFHSHVSSLIDLVPN